MNSAKNQWFQGLPNKISFFRIAVIPILLIVFPFNYVPLRVFCSLLFATAALSDLIDGFLARKFQSSNKLGAILDSTASQMLLGASILLLAHSQIIPAWLAGLLIVRELGALGLRLMALQYGIEITTSIFDKAKTVALSIAIFCMMINSNYFNWPIIEVGMGAFWVALFLSLYSAWEYFMTYWKNSEH